MDLESYRLQIYNKLIKDFTDKNVVVYNRGGEFYKINKPKYVNSGRDYGDAFIFGDDFHVHLHYWFGIDCSIYFKSLSDDKTSGSNAFHNFIETMEKNCQDLIFVEEDRKRNLLDFLYTHGELYFSNIEIDNKLLIDLKDKFKHCKEINFENCIINPNTDFNILQKQDVSFRDMSIEKFNMFSNTKNNYSFRYCDINLNKHVTLDSEKLTLINSKIDYTLLFITSSANKLKELILENLDEEDINNSYKYLADFAPNLEIISITGKVSDMKFLMMLKDLQIIELRGFYNIFGMSSPLVSNLKELDRLEEKNKENVEIKKILLGYKEYERLQNHVTCEIEVDRLLRICQLYNRLSYTKEDEIYFKNMFDSYYHLSDYVNRNDFTKLDKGYYESSNYKLNLIYDNLINPMKLIMPYEDKFIIEKEFLATYSSLSPIIKGKGVLFLYIDGRPIIFTGIHGLNIDTKEKAMELIKNYTKEEKHEDEDGINFMINSTIEELFNMENYRKDNNGEFKEYDFVDFMTLGIGERVGSHVIDNVLTKPFLKKLRDNYGNQLSEFYRCFEQDKKNEKEIDSYTKKNRDLLTKTFELVIKSNLKLTNDELLFLYKTINDCSIFANEESNFYSSDFILKILNYFKINVSLDKLTLDKLNPHVATQISELEQNKKEFRDVLDNRNIILSKEAIKQLVLAKPNNKSKKEQ